MKTKILFSGDRVARFEVKYVDSKYDTVIPAVFYEQTESGDFVFYDDADRNEVGRASPTLLMWIRRIHEDVA